MNLFRSPVLILRDPKGDLINSDPYFHLLTSQGYRTDFISILEKDFLDDDTHEKTAQYVLDIIADEPKYSALVFTSATGVESCRFALPKGRVSPEQFQKFLKTPAIVVGAATSLAALQFGFDHVVRQPARAQDADHLAPFIAQIWENDRYIPASAIVPLLPVEKPDSVVVGAKTDNKDDNTSKDDNNTNNDNRTSKTQLQTPEEDNIDKNDIPDPLKTLEDTPYDPNKPQTDEVFFGYIPPPPDPFTLNDKPLLIFSSALRQDTLTRKLTAAKVPWCEHFTYTSRYKGSMWDQFVSVTNSIKGTFAEYTPRRNRILTPHFSVVFSPSGINTFYNHIIVIYDILHEYLNATQDAIKNKMIQYNLLLSSVRDMLYYLIHTTFINIGKTTERALIDLQNKVIELKHNLSSVYAIKRCTLSPLCLQVYNDFHRLNFKKFATASSPSPEGVLFAIQTYPLT